MNNRLPLEFRKKLLSFKERREVYRIMRKASLSTVCEEAKCPNIGECFREKTATFMIMGDRCTRRCHFCSVTTRKPLPLDPYEPLHVAEAARDLGLDYVVITSVDRDDLRDQGARHFAGVIAAVKTMLPCAKIEILAPDFHGQADFLDVILREPIDVFGHNIETVARLYRKLRPQSDYEVTKRVLAHARSKSTMKIKTSLMVGLGENDDEVFDTLVMLKDIGVDIITIGQYLRPSIKHWPVERYVQDHTYQAYVDFGRDIGLNNIFAGPFVRSSYRAKETHIKAFSN